MHLADVFKLGYTTATPSERVKGLNTEQRNRTSQIGFFELVFARPVIDAYGAEQRLFSAISRFRVSKGKEFYCLPLDKLGAEIIAAAAAINEKVVATQNCPACGAVVRFTPLPMIHHICNECGSRFVCDARGQVLRFRPTAGDEVVDVWARCTMSPVPDRRSGAVQSRGLPLGDESSSSRALGRETDPAKVVSAPPEVDVPVTGGSSLSLETRSAAAASPAKKSWLGGGFVTACCPSCRCRHEVAVSDGSLVKVHCERCGVLFQAIAAYTSGYADEVAHRVYLASPSKNMLPGFTTGTGSLGTAESVQNAIEPLSPSGPTLPLRSQVPATSARPEQGRRVGGGLRLAVVEFPHCARLLITEARNGDTAHVVCQGCGRHVDRLAEAGNIQVPARRTLGIRIDSHLPQSRRTVDGLADRTLKEHHTLSIAKIHKGLDRRPFRQSNPSL